MFSPKTVHVRSVVDKVALAQVSLQVLSLLPVGAILPLLRYSSPIACAVQEKIISSGEQFSTIRNISSAFLFRAKQSNQGLVFVDC